MPETRTRSQTYGFAVSACSAGNLADAERLCRQIIASGHDDFDAVHLLAGIQSRLGNKQAAKTSLTWRSYRSTRPRLTVSIS